MIPVTLNAGATMGGGMDTHPPDANGLTPPVATTGGPSAEEILGYRPELVRIARLQLQRDAALAEDVVQDTLLAAIQGAAGFRGDASLKTWLVGILKYKLLDALRTNRRQPVPLSELAPELSTDDLDAMFDHEGEWRTQPGEWSDPAHATEQDDFLRILEFCLTGLPRHTARAFMLREMFGVETDEISRLLAITSNHLGVLLYRARMSLRRCIESHWLDQGETA